MARGMRVAAALAVVLALAGATPNAGATASDRTIRTETVSAEAAASSVGVGSVATGAGIDASTPGGADQDETTETNDTVEIETEGFDPGYDPATVLNRVEELRGLPAIQGITLHEYGADERPPYDMRDEFAGVRPAGAQALQLYSNASTERRQPLGYTVERHAEVHIYLLNASAVTEYGVTQQTVLAHEFVHALQFQHDLLTPSRREFQSEFPRWTTDSRLVTTAMVEGDAMWVTEQYIERYGESNFSVGAYNRSLARAAWPHSLAGTPYYYGYQFYARAGSSPDERSSSIQRPPNSTAELLHPGERVERVSLPDPPNVSDSERLSRYHADMVGELVVRHALRMNSLSFTRAADAADGWANGRMYYYTAANAAGPVTHWVTAWEAEREAREFVAAWREMLTANGARAADNGTLFVPASDQAPGLYYVVERSGATVTITAAERRDLAVRLAEAAASANETSSRRRP